MAFNVNTNFGSLVAQNNTSKTEGALNKAMTRLSSGLRVNGAADDAAGLAIAKGMSKDISGYEVNVRNANDAVSLLQVAEGGMDEIGNMLQRMKDLSLQSANGTNSTAQRANMDLEYQALISEIDRIVDTTTFNGVQLLEGSFSRDFQVDVSNSAGVDTINVAITDINTGALTANTGQVFISGVVASDTFSAGDTLTITPDLDDDGTLADPQTVTVTTATTVASFIDDINALTAQTEISAKLVNGDIRLYNNNVDSNAAADTTAAWTTGTATLGGSAIADLTVSVVTGGTALSATSISGADSSNANTAIAVIDEAITTITSERANIGASQNRFDKSINNLNNKIVNVSTAMGRIMDADFGKETAEFSKQSIIQQAGISMMAQAKSMPQQLLSLLQ